MKIIDDATLGAWIDNTCARYPILGQWNFALMNKSARFASNPLHMAADAMVSAADKQKREKTVYSESKAAQAFGMVYILSIIS